MLNYIPGFPLSPWVLIFLDMGRLGIEEVVILWLN